MKTIIWKSRRYLTKSFAVISGLILILALTVSANYAQEFTITSTAANTSTGRGIMINLPELNDNQNAIIVATPLGDTATQNPHPVGAWYYYTGVWSIINTDLAPMPVGVSYKIRYSLKPDANHFLHVVTKQNLGDEGSYLDHPLLNKNPNASVTILLNHAPDNRPASSRLSLFEAKALYNPNSGKWYLANVNGKLLSPNTAYNIIVVSKDNDSHIKDMIPPPPPVRISQLLTTSAATPPLPMQPTQPTPQRPVSAVSTAAMPDPMPCTKQSAHEKTGKWGKQNEADLAMADSTFPKEKHKAVLIKAQKVIELFKLANPEFKGIQANAAFGIRGESHFPNGALPFNVSVHYNRYYCLGNNGNSAKRGKIILANGYGSTIVTFNSFRDVLESIHLKSDGEEIFWYKEQLGEFKGFTMIHPIPWQDGKHEAVIITPTARLPYKPVTREQYLQARIENYRLRDGEAENIAAITSAIANMSPAERQAPALVANLFAIPGLVKLFAAEAEGGKHLVTLDKSFFNAKLPRDAIQFLTVYWYWNETRQQPKAEAIRQFKQNFDFEALRQMISQ